MSSFSKVLVLLLVALPTPLLRHPDSCRAMP